MALFASLYLIEQLGAQPFETLVPEEQFELDRALVENGVIVPPQAPQSPIYGWKNPNGGPDLLFFVGSEHPSTRSLTEKART